MVERLANWWILQTAVACEFAGPATTPCSKTEGGVRADVVPQEDMQSQDGTDDLTAVVDLGQNLEAVV